MYTIVVVGVGYVGLVSGACFSEMGNHVTCLDIDEGKIDLLREGKCPIYEPGLSEIVMRNTKSNRLRFTTSYEEAMLDAKICVLAVDTPVGPDSSCNLTSLKRAVRSIAEAMTGYTLVINKSTVPVGTNKLVRSIITDVLQERNKQFEFDVVSNPEFLKEGSAILDFMKPDRVVIGGDTERAMQTMRELYRPFMLGSDRILEMDPESAELTKYAANGMLALRISFMNWLSNLCDATGANILQIRKGIGTDKRIGQSFLWAGCGFGGSCFPKDIKALSQMAREHALTTDLIDAIEEINRQQKCVLVAKMEHYFTTRGGVQGKTIGILGLSFKPDTDDMREAPSLKMIEMLQGAGVHLRLYDPCAMPNAQKMLKSHEQITWCIDEYDALDGCDAIALVTEWKQFRLLDFERVRAQMKGRAFFDGRNQYCPKEMGKLGFDYFSIGQAPVLSVFEQEFFSDHAPELVDAKK